MQDLAIKYRPQTFDKVLGQDVVIKILQRQLEVKQYPHCYLFTGPSGDGKTTIARILANQINGGTGIPIEIDGASNNGVDNVRSIIEEASTRALDGEYKVFIIDECHMITTQGWNAFLKCIEEPPHYTIFMFCTTDPQKLPATILNRCMRFNLMPVAANLILSRLVEIYQAEGFAVTSEAQYALEEIVRRAQGSVRKAIVNFEQVLNYVLSCNVGLSVAAVQKVLNYYSYDGMLQLTNALVDHASETILRILETISQSGESVRDFFAQYLSFVYELVKYCIFKDMAVLDLPASLEEEIQYATGVHPTQAENAAYFSQLAEQLLNIKNVLKDSVDPKTTLGIMLLGIK